MLATVKWGAWDAPGARGAWPMGMASNKVGTKWAWPGQSGHGQQQSEYSLYQSGRNVPGLTVDLDK